MGEQGSVAYIEPMGAYILVFAGRSIPPMQLTVTVSEAFLCCS